jgi:hypothetical protein
MFLRFNNSLGALSHGAISKTIGTARGCRTLNWSLFEVVETGLPMTEVYPLLMMSACKFG